MANLQCQWCGEEWAKKGVRFTTLTLADHETKCPRSPHYVEPDKASNAWNPKPFPPPEGGRAPHSKTTHIVYIGGPYHGQQRQWDGFLVDGTRITFKPPPIHPGPSSKDSQGRMVSKYMGHYVFSVIDGCPTYTWVDTITPKKRLPKPRDFLEAFPGMGHLATSTEKEDP